MGSSGKIIGGLVAAAVVVTVIVVPCVLLIPDDKADNDVSNLPPYTFDDLYSNNFSYDYLYPNWDLSTTDNDGDHLVMSSDNSIWRQDITRPDENGVKLIDGSVYKSHYSNGYSVSATTQYVFYRFNYTKVWRHSYTADFAIHRTSDESQLSITGFPTDGGIHYMEWSPTGNKLAIVYAWNLWVLDLDATVPAMVQVTNDGEENRIYNAIPDWVYEEESISGNSVLYWSPDSTRIAFLRTDDTNTEIIEYSTYPEADQYPHTVKIAYPKAGTPIGVPSLWVYDLGSSELKQLASPLEGTGDHYFHRFVWMSEDLCLPTWSNRVQNESVATWCIYDAASTNWDCSLTGPANEEKVTNGWVGSFNPFDVLPLNDAGDYVTIYARANDDDPTDGYWQLVYVTSSNKDQAYNFMTKTSYDIVSLLHYDSTNNFVYFLAVYPEARDRQVMRVTVDDSDVAQPECMTCGLSLHYPDRCGWVSPTFNSENSKVVINCRGPGVPLTIYMDISSDGTWMSSAEQINVVRSNDQLAKAVQTVKWPVREYGKFQSSTGYTFNYEVWRPADFDPNKKYPLVIEVYAGPEFQKIQSTWTEGFAQTYMVSTRDIIVASVDGRGSAYQGYKFMQEVYMGLGQKEPVDQTEFAIYLRDTHNYIDGDNMAIWGWSYGGYTTSHTLGYEKGSQTFKCGVAVAPLADWRFYDAMYAERYMRMPQDNNDGYSKASIVTGHDLNNFKNTWYTLIHGTADDNVHFQNAAAMEKALVEAEVDFDDFFYADQAHSINIGLANQHVYRQIDHRLSSCLGKITSNFPENFIGN